MIKSLTSIPPTQLVDIYLRQTQNNQHIMKQKKTLHPRNKHKVGYDFAKLCKKHPALNEFVFENMHKNSSIDFANAKAVKVLNTALLLTHYPIRFWKFPDENLCPPIPGRVDYIHYLSDLLTDSNLKNDIKVLDIGTGASCIYPILGKAVYNWKFVATDVDHYALSSAQNIIDKNLFQKEIEIRHQKDKMQLFTGILTKEDKFEASTRNPPFFASQKEAKEANKAKEEGLGIDGKTTRNFSGNHNELWYTGGEKAFLHNYLYQSSLFKKQIFWFTTLVSKKENIKGMYQSLKKLKATEIKTIDMHQGNKITRIVAWTFLTDEEQKKWKV